MGEDLLLVKRFKNKDLTAFDEIFTKYYKQIYFFIYKMIYNPDTAEDISQDCFVKVFKGLKDAPDDIKLSSWIYKIANNTCIDYIRKNKISYELIDNVNCEDNESNEPEYNFLNRELNEKIKRVMLKIKRKHRTALILRDYNNLSYKEISNILGVSESAVKSLIHRARQEFQKFYREVD